MFKTVRTKSNKKGFTLAELLIVVAIIAILVAIAIPIYTGMLERAQIGVNKANARTVKGAVVAEILGDWDELKEGAKKGSGTGTPGKGWIGVAEVDVNGDLQSVEVYVSWDDDDATNLKEAIVTKRAPSEVVSTYYDTSTTHHAKYDKAGAGDDDQVVSASGSITPKYTIVVYVDEVETIEAGT